jgi:hypothetical protein
MGTGITTNANKILAAAFTRILLQPGTDSISARGTQAALESNPWDGRDATAGVSGLMSPNGCRVGTHCISLRGMLIPPRRALVNTSIHRPALFLQRAQHSK